MTAPVILQVIPSLGAGGAEQGCIDVARGVIEGKGRAFVVSHGGHRIPELRRMGAAHIDMPVHSKNPFIIYQNAHALKKIIQQEKVSLIHARSRAPAWSCYMAARAMDIPFITTCHAPYAIRNSALKKKYNAIMAKGDRVIAISQYVATYLRENYNVEENRLRLIPRGVDINRFHPNSVTPDRMMALAKAWRIEDGQRVILLPGRLTSWKGQRIALEAMAKLQSQDCVCVLVGADQGRSEYRKELEQLARDLNIEQHIRIVDHCADMPAAYYLSTLALSPSIEPEGFGRISIEAQAMGRIIIASRHGGSVETIKDGETGFLVNINDADDLAEKIDYALNLTSIERQNMEQSAMIHIHENFTVEQMVNKTLDVYAEVL
jgi:glycosyltransferase involved in cell wall biosynthesis